MIVLVHNGCTSCIVDVQSTRVHLYQQHDCRPNDIAISSIDPFAVPTLKLDLMLTRNGCTSCVVDVQSTRVHLEQQHDCCPNGIAISSIDPGRDPCLKNSVRHLYKHECVRIATSYLEKYIYILNISRFPG
jgi:hypothetical protein